MEQIFQIVIIVVFAALFTFSLVLGAYAGFSGIIIGIANTFDEDYRDNIDRFYNGKEPAKISWFFGPCMAIFPSIFQAVFGQIRKQVRVIVRIWKAAMRGFFLKKILFGPMGAILIAYQWPVGAILGSIWAILFSAIFFVFLVVFYLLFFPFWIIDRLFLLMRGYKNHCHNCNELSIVPQIQCPNCGEIHKHLAPNKYGIFHHVCICGCVLGSAYITGKAKYHAICPHCGEPFKTGATKPFTLQLIGGTSSGKTVYVASLLKELNIKGYSKRKVKVQVDPASKYAVSELDRIASGKSSPQATQGRDVTFYAQVIDMGKGKPPVKLEIIDIPGEMFAGETALQEGLHKMSQYKYADGFLFVVDPFADGDLVNVKHSDGTITSPISPTEVLHNFDSYLIAQRFAKTGHIITKPLSVIVTKSDAPEIAKLLTIEMIEDEFKANSRQYGNSFDKCRDEMVKQLLVSLSLADLVTNIEARFKDVHFYLVSSIGHAPSKQGAYEPIQVLESASWIMEKTKPALFSRIIGKKS